MQVSSHLGSAVLLLPGQTSQPIRCSTNGEHLRSSSCDTINLVEYYSRSSSIPDVGSHNDGRSGKKSSENIVFIVANFKDIDIRGTSLENFKRRLTVQGDPDTLFQVADLGTNLGLQTLLVLVSLPGCSGLLCCCLLV